MRAKIATVPYNRFLVCDRDLDHVVGFVDSKHLLRCVLEEKPIVFKEHGLVQSCQFIPDSLTLSEALDVFQRTKSDFAIILNEYALVVGLITINDIMSTVMGDLVHHRRRAADHPARRKFLDHRRLHPGGRRAARP